MFKNNWCNLSIKEFITYFIGFYFILLVSDTNSIGREICKNLRNLRIIFIVKKQLILYKAQKSALKLINNLLYFKKYKTKTARI